MNSTEKRTEPRTEDGKAEGERARILSAIRARATSPEGAGCFLCSWIVEDFEKNGKLSDYPYDSNGKGIFPYLGKVAHIRLEKPALDTKVGAMHSQVS